jgi:nucleotide-binding universal stress UspA family protein
MYKKILVPLDGSVLAESALPKAVELARACGSRIVLLRAAEAHPFPGADLVDAQVRTVREAEKYLVRVQEQLRRSGFEDVTTCVWYGQPASCIAEAAAFQDIDMIVMSTHGRSGFGRLLLGSVTESVLRETSTPILVLHPEGAPVEAPALVGTAGAD